MRCAGPGDKLKIHDEEEEVRREQEAAAKAGGEDVGSMVLMPPSIKREWRWAVMTVYRAEALPVMDGAGIYGHGKTDAFVTLEFGGGKPVATTINSMEGDRNMINPTFYQELWYPVSCPTATQVIKGVVWDSDVTENEMIATFSHRWNMLEKMEMRQTGMHWVKFTKINTFLKLELTM